MSDAFCRRRLAKEGRLVDAAELLAWLFGTKTGVIVLLAVALLGFLVAAIVLERRTRHKYDQYPDDTDSEDGWSFFDDDNN